MSGRARTRNVRGRGGRARPGDPPRQGQYARGDQRDFRGRGDGPRGQVPPGRRYPDQQERRPADFGRPGRGEPSAGPPPQASGRTRAAGKEETEVREVTRAMGAARIQPGGRPRRAPDTDTRTRPEHVTDKTGKSGRPLQVITNHCMLRSVPGHSIYQFNVSYKPPIESKSLRIALLSQQTEKLNLRVRVFDGMILYLPMPLDEDPKIVTSHTKDGSPVEVTFKLTNKVPANSPTCLQLLNILFRKVLQKLGMQQIGRHYYSNKNPTAIPKHRIELWPGFITSILQYEQNLMLCLDVSHKVLRTDTVLDFLYDLRSKKGRAMYDAAAKALVGEIVLTRYNNKTYRVDDIDWDKSPRASFKTATGEVKTLVDYYKQSHGIEIGDMDQPLIVSRPRRRDRIREEATGEVQGPILLIPEFCTRTGLSEEARSDFNVMKDVAQYTRQSPQQRLETMNGFINQLHSNPQVREILRDWNVEFRDQLEQVKARVLPRQNVLMKNDQFTVGAEADWSRDMRGKLVISSGDIRQFDVFFARGHRDSRDSADAFTNAINRVSQGLGIRLPRPNVVEIQNDRTETFIRAIQDAISARTDLVVCILPNNRKERYDAIKKLCIVDAAVPSQCILARTLKKANAVMSVTTKVALQLNCKLGGELWALDFPSGAKSSMIVGIDTYHDSMSKGRSAMGFVSTTNGTFTRYYSQCAFQMPGQELGDRLKQCMIVALKKWHEINGQLPVRIFVYRDGVGDGQLGMVVKFEVQQMLEAFSEFTQPFAPYIAVIVVKKRINNRLYRPGDHPRDPLTNPPPGTIVDTVITRPMWYDFFLCSQSVRQGTVTPTHFNVVVDKSRLPPDAIQLFTYKLCHMYYNWPGTVRVPAPCQYAHKLAFLLGQSIHTNPSDAMCDRLFFL